MKKGKPISCRWSDCCRCEDDKSDYCQKCQFYWFIDSGYGYCRALPEFVLVGWCRDVCSLYEEVEDERNV